MLKPVEYKCVVKLLDLEETDPVLARAVAAGIQLSSPVREREQQAQVRARMVAVGGNAFEDWRGDIPKPGDMVVIAKYSGLIFEDGDNSYRIINDKDVAAILED